MRSSGDKERARERLRGRMTTKCFQKLDLLTGPLSCTSGLNLFGMNGTRKVCVGIDQSSIQSKVIPVYVASY